QSSDPSKLASARAELLKLSQGISEQHVTAALEQGMWDAYFEPTTVTDQDVLRASFEFRNKDLNRCTAKDSFQCFWRIEIAAEANNVYERGWEVQFIPPARSTIKMEPEIYD